MGQFIKYMKPSSTTLIGHRGNQEYKEISEHTELLTFTVQCSDASGEEINSIRVTRDQLKQIRDEIDSYLEKTQSSTPVLKNLTEIDSSSVKINPSRVMSMKVGTEKWEARTRLFNGIDDRLVDLVATADSEEAARAELDKKFESFARLMTNFMKFMSQAS